MAKEPYPFIQHNAEAIQAEKLSSYTFARVGLRKTGHSISMQEILSLRADFAMAKDALHTPFRIEEIQTALQSFQHPNLTLSSQAPSKTLYLQRPDLGRMPDKESRELLNEQNKTGYDMVFIITNGLSAQAVNNHAAPLLQALIPKIHEKGYTIAPFVFVNNGRVAIADSIGEMLQAKLSVILVGERPGLSSPDSMGAYLTYAPKVGLTDERRNCISNIRPKGLHPLMAAEKLFYLINESFNLKLSGVQLKDDMNSILE